MDEPLSNLDAKLREEARYWIRKLILDLEICGVLVTHDQSEALAASDNILLLRNGAIVQEGTPQDIYTKPKSFYAADFLGANNIANGEIRRTGADASIHGTNWGLTMAITMLVLVPVVIIFFFVQRVFVEGITLTGVKG